MKKLVAVLALAVLAGCGGSRSRTPAGPAGDKTLSRNNQLALAAFRDGQTSEAAALYGKALTRATAMDDAAGISDAAYNLALCQTVLGQFDEAGATLADAREAMRRSGRNPADVLLLEATIAQRQDKWEQTLALADEALAASPNDDQRFQIALIQGTVACRQNDLTRARAALAETDKYRTTDGVLLAARERLNGNILWLEGNPAKAAAALDRAASLFQQAGQYHEMALTLARAAKAYQEAGDTQQAEDRRLRAERSLAAQKKTQ